MKNFLSDPRCARCNRILKDKESIMFGMGRACRKKHAAYVEKFYISLFPEVKHDNRRQGKTKRADAGRRSDKGNCKATVFLNEDDSARKKKDGPAEAEGLLQWTDGLSCTDA
jgi:hypothetical protein